MAGKYDGKERVDKSRIYDKNGLLREGVILISDGEGLEEVAAQALLELNSERVKSSWERE